MVKSLIMAKYMQKQKYMQAGMKNRKSPNRGLIESSKFIEFIQDLLWGVFYMLFISIKFQGN